MRPDSVSSTSAARFTWAKATWPASGPACAIWPAPAGVYGETTVAPGVLRHAVGIGEARRRRRRTAPPWRPRPRGRPRPGRPGTRSSPTARRCPARGSAPRARRSRRRCPKPGTSDVLVNAEPATPAAAKMTTSAASHAPTAGRRWSKHQPPTRPRSDGRTGDGGCGSAAAAGRCDGRCAHEAIVRCARCGHIGRPAISAPSIGGRSGSSFRPIRADAGVRTLTVMSMDAVRSLWAEPPRRRPAEGPQPRDWALVGVVAPAAIARDRARRRPGVAGASVVDGAASLLRHAAVAAHPPAGGRRGRVRHGQRRRRRRARAGTSSGRAWAPASSCSCCSTPSFRWGSGREVGRGHRRRSPCRWSSAPSAGDPLRRRRSAVRRSCCWPPPSAPRVRYQDTARRRSGPGQAARAGAAGPRAARHGRPPRVGHRRPGPGRAGRRAADPAAAARTRWPSSRRRRRGRWRRCARMVGALRRRRGRRPRPAAGRRRHRAARRAGPAQRPTSRSSSRRPRRAPALGRRRAVPARPGVDHQRPSATPATPPASGSRCAASADCVRLTVGDDGERPRRHARAPGFGLIGMAERAKLLGGTLEAGPRTDGGMDGRTPCCPATGPPS